jgi:hypothetical protein
MSFRDLVYDSETHADAVITSEHAKIHAGKCFTAYKNNTAIGASSYIDIAFVTPATTKIHLKEMYINNSGGIAGITILESPSTMTLSTSYLIAYNRDRSSTYSPILTLSVDSTYTIDSTATSTQATVIESYYIGSTGTAPARVQQFMINSVEFDLKVSTTYILRMKDISGNGGYGTLGILWYETGY